MKLHYSYLWICLLAVPQILRAGDGKPRDRKPAKEKKFIPGAQWQDTEGNLINAHGGSILYSKGSYYWFGEKRGTHASEGVSVYQSRDLYNWKLLGDALKPEKDSMSDIAEGCIMERPKVIHNAR